VGCAGLDPVRNYQAIPGTARIVEIADSTYDPHGERKYVDVFFDFIPDDPSSPRTYRYPEWTDTHQRLFINHRGNLPRAWIQEKGIRVGEEYTATRYERVRGRGSPVFFEVTVE
jgi:hypothetical protein